VVKSQLFRIALHIARDYPYLAAAWKPAARDTTPDVTQPKLDELSRLVQFIRSQG
jgi:hypothetical protein